MSTTHSPEATDIDHVLAQVRISPNDLIPVTVEARTPRYGVPMAVGRIPAGELLDHLVVPRYDHLTGKGYQRISPAARTNKLKREMKDEATDLPTNVVLNMRGFKVEDHLVVQDGILYLRLRETDVYGLDGQTRSGALAELIEEDPAWRSYTLPFSCYLGLTEDQEMFTFIDINGNAKSVPTDLAYRIVYKLSLADQKFHADLQASGKDWIGQAEAIVTKLANISPWQSRIRFPNEPKAKTITGSAAFTNSLKPLLDMPFIKAHPLEKRVEIVAAYWQGVNQAMPEAFSNPSDYAIQKATIGVQVLHLLAPHVIEIIRMNGDPWDQASSYAAILHDPLLKVQGENQDGDPVTGLPFWRSGPEGAAGGYASNRGRKLLLAKMTALMPQVNY